MVESVSLTPYKKLEEKETEETEDDRMSARSTLSSTSKKSFQPMTPPPLRVVISYLQKSSQTAIVTTIPAGEKGFEGWWWGGVAAKDGCIYYVPGGANRVLRFDPSDGARQLIGPELLPQGKAYASCGSNPPCSRRGSSSH